MNPAAALPTRRLERGTAITQAQPWQIVPVQPDSPAMAVMTDLALVKAASTHPSTTLREAEQIMIYQGVRMLFVVSEMPAVEGLITTTDLRGDRQLRVVHDRHMRYDELTVADVMTPLAMLDAIDFDLMKTATVGNMIATLKQFGRNHLLVVEHAAEAGRQRVRGVISRAQIERQLGSPIDVTEVATSFAELGQMLA
jgi:CBS domain containing-hemolysin-like protein